MFGYETVRAGGEDRERFVMAFYRYLEKHSSPAADAAWLTPGQHDEGPKALFSSRDEAKRFELFFSAFKLHQERPLRVGRFDDLRV